MPDRKENIRIHLAPTIAVVLAGLGGTLAALWILYGAALEGAKSDLRMIAQGQTRLIDAVARFDAAQSATMAGGPRAATISRIVDAHSKNNRFGWTGSFGVAERVGDEIVFVLPHWDEDRDSETRIPWNSANLAVPMRLALMGQSGVIVAPDNTGAIVLAAYEPIPFLQLGLVAKIDMEEVNAPFVRAGGIALAITAVLIVLAVLAFRRATDPILSQLVRSREEALAADRAKSFFLQNMSHELRTPLNAIIGFSDMIRQRVFGPMAPQQYADYVNNINRSGKHLLELVDDILDVGKIEGGRYDLAARTVGLKGVLEGAARSFGPQATIKNVEIRMEIPDDLPPAKADPAVARQIFANLIENAIKFTPEWGLVSIRALPGAGRLAVEIKDSGVGMTAADIARVTAPFTQVEREKGRHHEGLGLGLSLAKALTEMMGGAFALASEPGRGTTVTVSLPLA
ncbi:MAG: HAMP domain-containing histidine kinase [Alphaproteobacteria bacterium]|nr:HAMP domain-containing histidine kinase [Alphaproteobacteria bacterium]